MSQTVFLFPGQGSQAVGMGSTLYQNTEIGRKRFQEANEILGRDLTHICFDGPEEELRRTSNTQPALVVVSAILTDLLREKGVEPTACAGHSLGEYAALYAAGVFDFETAVKLVAQRGEEMSKAAEANPGAMAAIIGLDIDKTSESCEAAGGIVIVANDNCPGQLVISGEKEAVLRACEEAKSRGAKRALPLPVQGAYHSPYMDAATMPMQTALEAATFNEPKVPVIANVTAEPHEDPDSIKTLLAQQITAPVRWTESIRYLLDHDFGPFIEVGHGRVLSGLMRRIDRKATSHNIENENELEAVIAELNG